MRKLGIVLVVVMGLAASASAQLRPFALQGDSVPGANDTIDRVADAAALGADNVAFIARGNNNQYVIVDVAGVDTVIATASGPAPGGTYGATFSDLKAWGSQASFSSGGIVYLWSGATGVRRLALDGLIAANAAGQTLHLTTALTLVSASGVPTQIVALNAPVPSAPNATITSIGDAFLMDSGDVAFEVTATESGTGLTKQYLFQGSATAPSLRESTNTLPSALGSLGVNLLAASPQGDLAWTISYGTDNPTTSHVEVKLRPAGASSSATRIAEMLDGAPLMVGATPVQLDLSSRTRLPALTSSQLVLAGSTSGTVDAVVRYAGGTWQKVLLGSETLPGATGPGGRVSSVVGDRILLDGPGTNSGVWTWTNAVVKTIALPGQTFGSLVAQGVQTFSSNAADDDVVIGVAHMGSSGGTRVSGFVTANPAPRADLSINEVRHVFKTFDTPGVVVEIDVGNLGPDRVERIDVNYTVANGAVQLGCDQYITCQPTETGVRFTSPLGFMEGATLTLNDLSFSRSDSARIELEIVGLGADNGRIADPDLANNVRAYDLPKRPGDSGCQSTRLGEAWLLVVVAGMALRLRRRRASSASGPAITSQSSRTAI